MADFERSTLAMAYSCAIILALLVRVIIARFKRDFALPAWVSLAAVGVLMFTNAAMIGINGLGFFGWASWLAALAMFGTIMSVDMRASRPKSNG